MKKLLIGLLLAATPTFAFAQAELVDRDGSCFGFDGNLRFVIDRESKGTLVITAEQSGRWKLTCHGTLPATTLLGGDPVVHPQRALFVTADDTLPEPIVPTCEGSDDWVVRVTPAGRYHLTCYGEPD